MKYSRIKTHLKVAEAFADLSKAKRLKVGCVIIKDDRPISVGYNGTPVGFDNTCEDIVNGQLVTKNEVIHAEANALMFAAKTGTPTDGASIVLTHSPCFECAKLFIQAGIKDVYYDKEYRIKDSINFLKQNNIKVKKI